MERVIALIQKLQQQLEQKESAEKLLLTVQILYAELLPKQEKATPGSAKVALFMPVNLPAITNIIQNIKNKTNSNEPATATGEKIIEVLQVDEKEIQEELEAIKKNAEAKNKMGYNAKSGLLFDP